MSLLLNKKKLSYKLQVFCYFSRKLRVNRVRGSAQSVMLLGNRPAKVPIFSARTCVLRVLIEKRNISFTVEQNAKTGQERLNNERLCILCYPEPEQAGSPGSWRAS